MLTLERFVTNNMKRKLEIRKSIPSIIFWILITGAIIILIMGIVLLVLVLRFLIGYFIGLL